MDNIDVRIPYELFPRKNFFRGMIYLEMWIQHLRKDYFLKKDALPSYGFVLSLYIKESSQQN